MEMSSMLRSRCSSSEGWGGEVLHQNVGGPFWVYETTQLLRCCPEILMDLSTKNLEAVGSEPTPALKKHFESHI